MSTKSKQQKVSSTGARVLRPRQPVPPEDRLKAERVQLAGEPYSERLKAERVQQRLKAMPGWRLAAGGKSVDRLRQFPSMRVAASFAGFLTQFAAYIGQPIAVDLQGKHLTITVRARNGSGLTEAALDFAQALG
jgi:pterin-4a-carbinolamine dehydratase